MIPWARGKPLEAEQLFLKALALDPNDRATLFSYSIHLAAMGRVKEALAMAQEGRALEPFVLAKY